MISWTLRAIGRRGRPRPHAKLPFAWCCPLLLAAALVPPASGQTLTVRDDFSTRVWNNNDGSTNWVGNWIEVDGASIGPTNGNVWITGGGELRLEDRPNTGGQPSAAREVDLTGAVAATLSFDWRTTGGVDASDAVVAEVSPDGGASWTVLETFTGIVGSSSGSRSYDIAAFASVDTQVRLRVTNLYGGSNESFRLDFVEVAYSVALTGADVRISQVDTPDPVNVASPLSYTLTVLNGGPEDATGVSVTDTLPTGTTLLSASASQGSCTPAGATVNCAVGDLANGATATINIVLSAPVSAGTISNVATVSANESDPVSGNNSSTEDTTVQNLNINQLCYLVADSGGGNGGNDLLTSIDTADFDPATNETNIGTGTGTSTIEAIAFNSATGTLYGANAGRLGVLNLTTGVFQQRPQSFGTGSGSAGNVTFSDVDGLTYDATTGVLYGSHRRGGNDLLIQIDMATGAHVPNAFGANVDYVEIQAVAGNTLVDDIAVDPTTGLMYASTNSGGSTDRLIIVDKATGATANVALITVPDIEGLGTDPTGQLWGTSGTQRILYEINKATGVGSNGRTINNGSDYEAVDCFATSPSVTSDLSVTKIVDQATPQENDTVSYTVTVANGGPGIATVVQVMDLLPSGVTFVSAATSQGTYDVLTGDWFVGTLGVGGAATLTLQADVDSGTGGTTITNTATVEFRSQFDPNAGNDSASADINPNGAPILAVTKSVVSVSDPINGSTNPFSIPGATVRYDIVVTNSGTGTVDADTLAITDAVPAGLVLRVADFDGGTPGPIEFVDGTPASGLTYNFVSLDDLGDDVAFSADGGLDNFEYEPTPDAAGLDSNVTHIRITPSGPMLGNTGGGDPNARVRVLMVVQ